MICKSSGFIQEYIDCELDIEERKNFELHMKECEICRKKYIDMKDIDDFCFSKINEYSDFIDKNLILQPSNFEISERQNKRRIKKGVITMIGKYKKIAVIAGCLALSIIMLSVQPVRAAVVDMIKIFRVENVEGFNISLEDMEVIGENLNKDNPNFELKDFGKVESTGGKINEVSTDKLIKEKNIKVLKDYSEFKIDKNSKVISDFSMDFTLEVDKVNEFMKSYGAKTLLPEKINGRKFVLNVPEQIYIKYNSIDDEFTLLRFKKPEILAENDADVETIRKAMLGLPFIPDSLKNKLESIKDWKTTLYIPYVNMKQEDIKIGGENAILLRKIKNIKNDFVDSDDEIIIVWTDGSYIYNMTATSRDKGIELANLLR